MGYVARFNEAVFFWINQDGGHHYAWLDSLMIFLSDSANGVIGLALLTVFAFWRSGKPAWRVLALMVVLILLSDWSGTQIKHWFATERPCNTLEAVRLLASYCGRNSFPSNHAINMAAVATYLGWHYRVLIAPMAVLAVLVGVSRIYVGVHYPGDVFFGWIWGALLATAFYWIFWRVVPLRYRNRRKALEEMKAHEEEDE